MPNVACSSSVSDYLTSTLLFQNLLVVSTEGPDLTWMKSSRFASLGYSNTFVFKEAPLTFELQLQLSMMLTAVCLLEQSLHWIVIPFTRHNDRKCDTCLIHL